MPTRLRERPMRRSRATCCRRQADGHPYSLTLGGQALLPPFRLTWGTETINDGELAGFVQRALDFAKR